MSPLSSFRFFLFNDPAPTVFYTYGPPLSLHAALPISLCRRRLTLALAPATGSCSPATRSRSARASSMRAAATRRSRLAASAVRSEEHTSELQSLMRTSYAVFCLKQKNDQHRDALEIAGRVRITITYTPINSYKN